MEKIRGDQLRCRHLNRRGELHLRPLFHLLPASKFMTTSALVSSSYFSMYKCHDDVSPNNVSPNENSWTKCPLVDASPTLERIQAVDNHNSCTRNSDYHGCSASVTYPTHGPHQVCPPSGLWNPHLTYPDIPSPPHPIRDELYRDASSKNFSSGTHRSGT
jgi:hypothetical protein